MTNPDKLGPGREDTECCGKGFGKVFSFYFPN